MIDFLKYVLSDFWKFVGFVILLNIFLFYTVNGIVRIFKHLRK